MQVPEAGHAFPFEPVVTRWVRQRRRPPEQVLADVTVFPVGEPIALGPGGELRFDGPFACSDDLEGTVTWRADARLVTAAASAVRFARVEISVIVWSDELSEVSVRSRGRHLVSWGARRERRYFALAHDAATHVASALAASDAPERGQSASRVA